MKYARPSMITAALLSGGLGLISTALIASASTPLHASDHPTAWQTGQQQIRLSLSQAIDAAEAAFPGRTIEAELDIEHGTPHYEMEIITPQDSHIEVHVDVHTGAAFQHKIRGPASPNALYLLDTSKLTLKQALDAALLHTPGTAVEAELHHHRDRSVFSVKVVTASGQRIELKLDAQDGRVLSAHLD